ncbi:MAG TPA: AraC family transcriptional regulator [Ohtaekwangia sp.]|nr:AraC family transcriptional regulator [Ohtaekwangia sp.]
MKEIPIRSILPLTSKNDDFEGFRIFKVSDILLGRDLDQELHRHDFYFILLLTKGIGNHEIDFVEQPVTDNSISIMRPGQVHRFELKAGSEGYWLAFNKEFQLSSTTGNALLRKAASQNFLKLNEKRIGQFCSILKTILDEYTLRQTGFDFIIKANLEIFFILFLRCRQKERDTSIKANQYHQEKLQEFLELLETNISTKKHAAAYADMVNLSPFQLNSITKSLLGKTVANLIDDQILLEAKRYLLGTPHQVSQIADQLGYMDVSYFIRFFKKKMGVTPEAFRNNFEKSHSTLQ